MTEYHPSAADMEAEAHLVSARVKAKFFEALIQRFVLPASLLIGAPAAVGFMANQNSENKDAIQGVGEIVSRLSATLERADRRLKELDAERAAEIERLHETVTQLTLITAGHQPAEPKPPESGVNGR